ncbi:hypothetical protein [Gimesia sp.]|uniref:hypothetical protein n=1 Tax=Gimesia sp. TaxID=2024833 RepID=UPI0025BE33BC|nr:hypothetical protein [Gimesia sp.]
MSWFMFTHLPACIPEFLKRFHFPAGCESPFANLTGFPKAIIFSELDLGKQGFGCPDGAIYVECPDPTMLFLEVKLNETYEKSCRGKSYNSTLQGQLELKWRFALLYINRSFTTHNNVKYLQETPVFRNFYKDVGGDPFYKDDEIDEDWPGSWRRLKIVDGVKNFTDLLAKCDDRVYFAAITKDERNPFDNSNPKLPRCAEKEWPEVSSQFCWAPISILAGPEEQEITHA